MTKNRDAFTYFETDCLAEGRAGTPGFALSE